MPIITFSNRDLLRGTIAEPSWYKMRIDSIGEVPSADGKSTNYPVAATIICNADNGDTKFAEVPVDWNFNSKAIGFAVGFLQAFGENPVAGQRFDLASAEGKFLDVFVETGSYQGRMKNEVNHKYRVAKAA